MKHETDVAVIGAGTAGIAAERSARSGNVRTLLIDDRFAGTTCATVGCMPSKLLIAAAQSAYAAGRASLFGVHTGQISIDGPAVMRRVRAERDRFAASTRESFEKMPEGVCIRARARFVDATTLELDNGDTVRARVIVIATGSRSAIPETFAALGDSVLTNETIFEIPDLPKTLAVIGAGPLGLELAQAFSRLGVGIRVFDETEHLSGIADAAVEKACRSILQETLPMSLGTRLDARAEADGVVISWRGATQGSERFAALLVAAGRPPNLTGLNLEATGLELDAKGTPVYDPESMRCGHSSIFIAGDADHDRPVLHEAAAEGAIAGKNAARYPEVSTTQRYAPLSVMFTDPQVAIAGKIPKPGTANIVCGSASYADQGRAKMFAENRGLVNLYAEKDTGRLYGAALCGPAVEHSAHLLAWAIQRRMTASEVLRMPIYHPTYEEGLKPALRSICETVRAPVDDMQAPGE